MTQPSVETAEGRKALRALADREYSLEPDWYAQFQAALHALDARDKANRTLERKIRVLEAEIRVLMRLADAPDELGAAAHKIAALEVQLAEARAAERADCIRRVEDLFINSGGEILCGDTLDAAIRALRDPGEPGEICPYCGNQLGSHWQDCPTCAGAGDPRDPGS